MTLKCFSTWFVVGMDQHSHRDSNKKLICVHGNSKGSENVPTLT